MDSSNEGMWSTHRTLGGWQRDGSYITFQIVNTQSDPKAVPEGVAFVVNETSYVTWDHALPERNLEFLRGIDAAYYRFIGEVHAPLLSGGPDQRQRAATAIRMGYSAALETFCALLATAVQSPGFALGWMLQYTNRDLRTVIRKLYDGKGVPSVSAIPFSWLAISEAVHSVSTGDPDANLDANLENQLRVGCSAAWRRLSGDFINKMLLDEYNSLKHGHRARVGGFRVSVGPPVEPGMAPPPELWTRPSGSPFGSTFYTASKLPGKSRNHVLTRHHYNWVPQNMVAGLELLSMSINNLVMFLRFSGGDAGPFQIQRPTDPGLYTAPWAIKLEFDRLSEHPIFGPL